MSRNNHISNRPVILLADDDPVLRDLAEVNLTSAGFSVLLAENGQSAFEILENEPVDLIITDIDMPDLDGLALTGKIRQSARLSSLPVIVITGKDQTNIVDDAFAAGATSFINKPLNWELLPRSVRFVLAASQNEQALRIARDEAESAARMKQAILANLNHELRTPLNHIVGFSELLSTTLATQNLEEYKQYADFILSGGRRLLRLVSDMVFLSAAETDGVDLEIQQTGSADILAAVESQLAAEAAEKNITLTSSVQDNIFLAIDGDVMIRALVKLVDNAIKFSPPETRVTFGIILSQDSNPRPVFFVQDEGPGVPEDKLSELGQLFRQGDMDLARKNEGMGTGIRIASLIAEAHGGSLKFRNREEGGFFAALSLPTSAHDLVEKSA